MALERQQVSVSDKHCKKRDGFLTNKARMTIKNMTKEIKQSSIEKDAANDSGGVAGERSGSPRG